MPGFPPAVQHLPISATDFVPAQQGHPYAAQLIANMQLNPMERQQVYASVNEAFNQVNGKWRANNLAAAMSIAYSQAIYTINATALTNEQTRELVFGFNDAIAQGPAFAQMSNLEKQNSSDAWIFETAMITMLRARAMNGDRAAAQQAVALSRMVVQKITGQ